MKTRHRLLVSPKNFSITFSMSILVATLAGCAPAKWAENLGGRNGASGSHDPGGVQSPRGQSAVESFEQDNNANKVDILIVNDNSASMQFEQSKMASRFTSFISDLKSIDYRIAMTTTDLDSPKWHQDGKILPWSGMTSKVLLPSTPNAQAKFENTIRREETIDCKQRSDCPSPNEQPLKAIELAIDQAKTANKELFRDGVDFVVVILSDEDEMSTGPANSTQAAHVVQHFKDAFADSKRLAVHGLVVLPGDNQCLAIQRSQDGGTQGAYGTHVAELASLTAGSLHSICDNDYAKDLASISTSVRHLISGFDLKERPRDGTVSVVLTPAFKTTWTVEQNRVVFNPPPPAKTKIEITYQY